MNKYKQRIIELCVFLLIFFVLYKVDASTFKPSSFYFRTEDIYFESSSAKDIQKGINPYNRVLEGNMLENDKYATMFPLYYYFLAGIRIISENKFTPFISNFRNILFLFQLTGGVFIYLTFKRLNKKLLGFGAALFYMFNLWSLDSFVFLKQDMIAISFLLASFYFFGKSNKLSYLLYGFSLGIKHIGIFAFPLYLTPIIFNEQKPKEFVSNLFFLGIPVFFPALPFIFDNYKSLFNSMLFSFTRTPKYGKLDFGYKNLLVNYSDSGLNGTTFDFLLPRLPLFLASVYNIFLLFTKRIPRSFFLLTSILIFAIFNPVIFPQYITWIPPFLFIGLVDYLNFSDSTKSFNKK